MHLSSTPFQTLSHCHTIYLSQYQPQSPCSPTFPTNSGRRSSRLWRCPTTLRSPTPGSTTGSLVAKSPKLGFRANTAQAYLEAFLRHPDRCVIIFDCGAMRGTSDRIEIDMFYQGIDPNDGGRVVFHEGEDSHELSGEKKHKIWRKKMERYLGAADRDENIFDLTPYIICIYGVALDSELPGLRFDVEGRRISFEWEGMLNAFILERKEIDRRIMEAERKDMDRELRNRQKIPAFTTSRDAAIGLFGPLIGELQMMSINTKNRRRSIKKVRRHRILKFHRQKLGFEMTVDLIDRKHESKQVKRVNDADQDGIGGD